MADHGAPAGYVRGEVRRRLTTADTPTAVTGLPSDGGGRMEGGRFRSSLTAANGGAAMAATLSGRSRVSSIGVTSTGDSASTILQIEALQQVFAEKADIVLNHADFTLVNNLRNLAAALERSLTMVCPEGHPLIQKTVTGSWFSSKHCGICQTELSQGALRYSCRQCAFHLCATCFHPDAQGSKPAASTPVLPLAPQTLAEFFEDTAAAAPRTPHVAMAMPVTVSATGWILRGVYEQQALKIGLRQLGTRLEVLKEPPPDARSKGHFLREKLIMDLVTDKIDLQQVHPNDIAAAQGDVGKLQLTQLLHLSVKNGGPVQQGPRGEFLRAVDNALYKKLAHCVTSTAKLGCESDDVDEMRRLGREAVLLVAAGAAIAETSVWNWWLFGGRVFFDTATFSCVEAFPKKGVLEHSDYSKVERFAGRSLDWQVRHVKDEAELRTLAEFQRRKSSACHVSGDAIAKRKSTLRSIHKDSQP
eukprot:TRINITY_DN34915_c0_g2_i1.p1 TRINITY_DN34915_c0_g2~~TRINITY_DN34915_c0_g2_i1.p1  ORF type:complete len:474 (+),score=71.42 TRINITY_DN34915_c0_g2_i1:565-1986(+)